MSVSVLILTLNEELNLPRALASVEWCDDIVVVDSGSIDGTLEIAREAGARIFEHPFEDWSSQGNWAINHVEWKNPWVYYMDADEVMPEDLIEEIQRVTREAGDEMAAYRLRYKNFYMGRWLKHATLYPTWITRLMRPGRIHYEKRLVNPHPNCEGEVGFLEGHFHHYSFHRGLEHWIHKHNQYSSAEAAETLKSWEQPLPWGDFICRDPVRRRRALKLLSMRMPFRPLLKFLYMYIWRRGFLDGYPGYSYCILQATYEGMIVAKVREHRFCAQGNSM